MSGGWTKLHSSITESTIWLEPDRTRLLWLMFLATKDEFGRVFGSVPGLAHKARIPIEDVQIAIQTFLAPDPHSRTQDFEGRRIDEIDGGWRVINHQKYREARSDEDRKEQNRLAQQRYRERVRLQGDAAASARKKPPRASSEK